MAVQADRRLLVSAIVGCAYFMYALDSTIIATALPQMALSLGVNPVRLSIVIIAYVVSMAVFVPVSGWLADQFGACRIFAAAIAVFTLGSLFCGLSNNILELAAARVLQGAGGAMVLPVGRLVILRSVPKSGFVKAMAMLGLFPTVGSMLGPVVGGFITTYASWRWIFLINIPIGVIGIILVLLFVENFRGDERRPLDGVGFALTGLSLACVMYSFEAIGRGGSELAPSLLLLAVGVVSGVLAVRHVRIHPNPLLDLSLLRIPTLRKNITGGSLFRVTTGGISFLLPLLFQVVFGLTAFASGGLTVALAGGVLSVRLIVQWLLRSLGFRVALVVNGLVSGFGILACCLLTQSTPAAVIVLLLYVIGFAQGFQFTTLNTVAYADIESNRLSAATSFSQLFQQLSQGCGVAIAAALLHLAVVWHGGQGLARGDVAIAFVGLACFGLAAVWSFWTMAADAGEEVSGHHSKPLPQGVPASD